MRAAFAFAFALAGPAVAEHPPGWTVGGEGYEVVLDREHAYVGVGSLRITQVAPGSAGFALRRIPVAELDGAFVRVSAQVAARGVDGGYAGLVLRFDDAAGAIVYLDNMRDRGVTGDADWRRHDALARVPERAAWLVYGALVAGEGTAWFDSFFVEALAAEALPAASSDAVAYLERALNILERHSFRRAHIDWPAFRADVLASARGLAAAADTHPLLRDTLRRLGDRHSRLMVPREARAWHDDGARAERPLPTGLMVDDRIAYVDVPPFDGDDPAQATRYADALHAVVAEQADAGACGWIVDLRGNSGGNMWPMLAGLAPLFGAETIGGFEHPGGESADWWVRGAAAGVGAREAARASREPPALPDGTPVAVLTGPVTASSGEAVAVAFRGRPHARSFGAPTAGIPTGNQLFELSDGALLWLTTSRFVDRTGRAYESALPPDEPAADASAAARGWLQRVCAPTNISSPAAHRRIP